ncbi:unnamed protein product [Cylindrotheca closterium]|uniref:Helicase-associated domain-containing protein n=1 Tax=Cylindrotheca closterium TaxID=2856 RepID=A0AAD2CMB7_9STRA|nr:unnamed protein product [Cylindrotheca closterium]
MGKENPFEQNVAIQQQGEIGRFVHSPMARSKSSMIIAMDFSLDNSPSMDRTSQTNFILNSSDIYEPLPITATSIHEEDRPGGVGIHSFITLASTKLDSLPEIDDDAILFDRLAEVCSLGTIASSIKRASPIEGMCHSEEPLRKKQKHVDAESEDESCPRFRPYQQKHWDEQFEGLLTFRADRGHCCVPHDYENNKLLSRWVRRQRYQYKLKQENKKSTMTDARILKLNNIGFVWDSHAATWSERLSELTDYLRKTGNCNVPATYPPNPPLSTWVKCQRRQYKLFNKGLPSNMTMERVEALGMLGFEWDRSNGKRNRRQTNPKSNVFCALTEEL